MWLLIVQGLLVNAYVGVRQDMYAGNGLTLAGILVTLSAFVILYKSYQARGYLHFLGTEAKRGQLPEAYLPLDGWQKKRIKHWRGNAWVCPWLERASDVLEPYLFLPNLLVSTWIFLLLQTRVPLPVGIVLGVAVLLATCMLAVLCIGWVWSQRTDEEARTAEPVPLP
jgi:hypothetical protein